MSQYWLSAGRATCVSLTLGAGVGHTPAVRATVTDGVAPWPPSNRPLPVVDRA